jgi:hypothetical protein
LTDDGHGDLEEIRRLLSARAAGCWLRLEDAVSELVAVHGVSDDEVLARVRELLAQERAAASNA